MAKISRKRRDSSHHFGRRISENNQIKELTASSGANSRKVWQQVKSREQRRRRNEFRPRPNRSSTNYRAAVVQLSTTGRLSILQAATLTAFTCCPPNLNFNSQQMNEMVTVEVCVLIIFTVDQNVDGQRRRNSHTRPWQRHSSACCARYANDRPRYNRQFLVGQAENARTGPLCTHSN